MELAGKLDPGLPVYALVATGLIAGETSLASIPEMASRYVEAIREVQEHGPYRLIGYSSGGVIAYAIAEQLFGEGENIGYVGLVDSHAEYASPAFSALVQQIERDAGTGLDESAIVDEVMSRFVPPEAIADFKALAATGDSWGMALLLKRLELIPADLDADTWRRLIAVRSGTYQALYRYRPSALPISATLFRAGNGTAPDPSLGWGAVIKDGLRIVSIEGSSHETLMASPHVIGIANAINDALGDGQPSP